MTTHSRGLAGDRAWPPVHWYIDAKNLRPKVAREVAKLAITVRARLTSGQIGIIVSKPPEEMRACDTKTVLRLPHNYAPVRKQKRGNSLAALNTHSSDLIMPQHLSSMSHQSPPSNYRA
jgi:hypothetical protein